jgi:hypothetical protein
MYGVDEIALVDTQNETLEHKREEVVKLAAKIIAGEADYDTFHYAFSMWIDSDTSDWDKDFDRVIENCQLGLTVEDEDYHLLEDIAEAALEAAAILLYNTELDFLLVDEEGYIDINDLIGRII